MTSVLMFRSQRVSSDKRRPYRQVGTVYHFFWIHWVPHFEKECGVPMAKCINVTTLWFCSDKISPRETTSGRQFVAVMCGQETQKGPLTFWKAESSSRLSKAGGWSSPDSTITRLVFRGEAPCLRPEGSSGSCTMGESAGAGDGVCREGLSSSGVPLGEPGADAAFSVSDPSVPGVVTLKQKGQSERADAPCPHSSPGLRGECGCPSKLKRFCNFGQEMKFEYPPTLRPPGEVQCRVTAPRGNTTGEGVFRRSKVP